MRGRRVFGRIATFPDRVVARTFLTSPEGPALATTCRATRPARRTTRAGAATGRRELALRDANFAAPGAATAETVKALMFVGGASETARTMCRRRESAALFMFLSKTLRRFFVHRGVPFDSAFARGIPVSPTDRHGRAQTVFPKFTDRGAWQEVEGLVHRYRDRFPRANCACSVRSRRAFRFSRVFTYSSNIVRARMRCALVAAALSNRDAASSLSPPELV